MIKGPGGVLPPRDVILAHEIIAQRRSVSKAQQSVRLLERHLFDEIERPVLRAQQHAHMPDKQQRSLLARLIVKEHRDEAYSLAVAEAHAALSPLRLHGPHMAPDLRAVLRFHGGIQRAEIVQTAPAPVPSDRPSAFPRPRTAHPRPRRSRCSNHIIPLFLFDNHC